MSPTSARVPGRLLAIEALRGLAALSVATVHALGAATALGAPFPKLLSLPWLAGVDVFFVVSGFVMVHAAREKFGTPDARRRFVAHRIARVAPLYWLVSTAFVALALLRPAAFTDPLGGWASTLASYLFIPWPRADGGILPVFRLGWTLEFEALFYAIFAAWLGARRPVALAGVLASLAALGALGAAWTSAPPTIRFWTDPIILEFGFGVALAIAHGAGARLPGAAAPLLVAAALALLWRAAGIPDVWSRPFVYGLPAAMLVALALLRESSRLPTWLSWLALRAGAMSYALYLSHLFAVRFMREIWSFAALSPTLFVPAALVASVALAVLVHRAIERPAVAAFRRWLA